MEKRALSRAMYLESIWHLLSYIILQQYKLLDAEVDIVKPEVYTERDSLNSLLKYLQQQNK